MAIYRNNKELQQFTFDGNTVKQIFQGTNELYTIQRPPPPPWTPEDATGILYWWRADQGITLGTGNDVTQWDDIISGYSLTPTGNEPQFVSSTTGMNNQPSIEFGSVGVDEVLANTTEQTFGGSVFFFFVIDTTTNANGGFQILGGAKGATGASGKELLIETNHPSYANSFTVYSFNLGPSGGPTTNTGISVSAPERSWVGVGYENGVGNSFWRNGSETVIGSGANTPSTLAMRVGNYYSDNLPYYGRVMEWGVLKDYHYWNDSEGSLFASYVSQRYGI